MKYYILSYRTKNFDSKYYILYFYAPDIWVPVIVWQNKNTRIIETIFFFHFICTSYSIDKSYLKTKLWIFLFINFLSQGWIFNFNKNVTHFHLNAIAHNFIFQTRKKKFILWYYKPRRLQVHIIKQALLFEMCKFFLLVFVFKLFYFYSRFNFLFLAIVCMYVFVSLQYLFLLLK